MLKTFFNCLKLENVDKGCRCRFGTARRETPSREKKRRKNLNCQTVFLHFAGCGEWLGFVALPCAAVSQFLPSRNFGGSQSVTSRGGKGKGFKLLEMTGTFFCWLPEKESFKCSAVYREAGTEHFLYIRETTFN